MPLYLDPEFWIKIRLDGDVERRGNAAPVFVLRPTTLAMTLNKLTEQDRDGDGENALLWSQRLKGFLEEVMVRLEIPGKSPMPPEEVIPILTLEETLELFRKYQPVSGMTYEDKKKQESPSKSGPETSADTAAAESATTSPTGWSQNGLSARGALARAAAVAAAPVAPAIGN